MAEPFLAEIRLMSFNFAPKGWALCNGQLLPINQNQGLFSLLGTTFGGDGRVNFGLPNLQGRVPIHVGSAHVLGDWGGEQAHTLNISELPTHVHTMNASASFGDTPVPYSDLTSPKEHVLAASAAPVYRVPGSGAVDEQLAALYSGTVGSTGGSQLHENRQPFLVLNFCIALQGIFPSAT